MKILSLIFLLVASVASAKFQYVSPMQGSTNVDPQHNIVIREGNLLDEASFKNDLFSLNGSKSGDHAFRIVLSDDQKTVLLYPLQPFGFDEVVTVTIHSGIKTRDGRAVASYAFSFSTHREYTAQEKENFKKLPDEVLAQGLKQYDRSEKDADDPNEPGQQSGSFTIMINNNPTPGDIFYDSWSGLLGSTQYDGYNIISTNGDSVYSSGDSRSVDFSINPDGFLSVYNNNTGAFNILDSNYNIIDTYYPGNGYTSDEHEFTRYKDGRAFMIAQETHTVDMTQYGGSPNATMMTTIIQEFNKNKNVIFEWRAWDHITFTETNQSLTNSYIDLVHTNSIDLDTDGNIIVSNRHLNQVCKLDLNTGDFIWRLGGVMNQFTFVGDNEHFSFEHDARRISNGNITLWDNGNGHIPTHSSAKEYKLDLVNMTATLVWKFQPKTYSNNDAYFLAMGSVQRLPNGNTLVNGGCDYSSNQSNIWEVTPSGEVVWELAFENSNFLIAYRALKYTWDPCAPIKASSQKVKNLTSTSAKIQWRRVNNVTSYDFQFRKQGSVTWKLKTLTVQTIALDNLMPDKIYEYQVRAHCANGFAGDWTEIKTFKTLPQKLLNEEQPMISFQLHPNPTDGLLTIDVNLEEDQPVTFSVYDLSGRVVFTSTQLMSAGEQSVYFDLKDIPAAVYFAEVKMPAGSQSIKFVKQ